MGVRQDSLYPISTISLNPPAVLVNKEGSLLLKA